MALRSKRHTICYSCDKAIPESSVSSSSSKLYALSSNLHFIHVEFSPTYRFPSSSRYQRRIHPGLAERGFALYSKTFPSCFFTTTCPYLNYSQFLGKRSQPGFSAHLDTKFFHGIFRSRTRRYGPTLVKEERSIPKGGDGKRVDRTSISLLASGNLQPIVFPAEGDEK